MQREAAYALFYCLSQSCSSSTKLFNNQYSVERLLEALKENKWITPETVMAILSSIDLICEREPESITVFIDMDVIQCFNDLIDKWKANAEISKFSSEILDKYFEQD